MLTVFPDQENIVKEVTCISEGMYSGSLKYSHIYHVIAYDTNKRQIKVQNENGSVRWYPEGCFAPGRKEVLKVARILSADSIEGSQVPSSEVTIELSDGQRRWCFFMTPDGLAQLDGEKRLVSACLIMYDASHMIVLSKISLQSIEEALSYIECQGKLLACTRSLEELSLELDGRYFDQATS
ncbi:MAG TPA: hypothetical protein VFV38_35555 [Ktedonobacteraceae bacterium]|nr:hypothetical protein [Ktedonobacteraceae bacterium]